MLALNLFYIALGMSLLDQTNGNHFWLTNESLSRLFNQGYVYYSMYVIFAFLLLVPAYVTLITCKESGA